MDGYTNTCWSHFNQEPSHQLWCHTNDMVLVICAELVLSSFTYLNTGDCGACAQQSVNSNLTYLYFALGLYAFACSNIYCKAVAHCPVFVYCVSNVPMITPQ